jgi:xanthine dehydrogenase accessory factor
MQEQHELDEHQGQQAGDQSAGHMDPVCGMTVKESPTALKIEYQSKTYYFCGPGCRRAFEKNAEKYLSEGPSMHM